MALLSGHGIDVDLPVGWDGRLYRREPLRGPLAQGGHQAATTHAVLHAANFPLPNERGDFGSGAVERMGRQDVLVVLVEMGPESVGTPLFDVAGLPRQLSPQDFSPDRLQRTMPGQAGTQVFFSSRDRAFCLYVVLGGPEAGPLMPMVNSVLQSLRIGPR